MWFKHSMSIAQKLLPIYNTTVHKNMSYVALNVVKLFVPYDLFVSNQRWEWYQMKTITEDC